jgi:hypothetical protein
MLLVTALTYSNDLVKVNLGKATGIRYFVFPKVISVPQVSDKRNHMLLRHTIVSCKEEEKKYRSDLELCGTKFRGRIGSTTAAYAGVLGVDID